MAFTIDTLRAQLAEKDQAALIEEICALYEAHEAVRQHYQPAPVSAIAPLVQAATERKEKSSGLSAREKLLNNMAYALDSGADYYQDYITFIDTQTYAFLEFAKPGGDTEFMSGDLSEDIRRDEIMEDKSGRYMPFKASMGNRERWEIRKDFARFLNVDVAEDQALQEKLYQAIGDENESLRPFKRVLEAHENPAYLAAWKEYEQQYLDKKALHWLLENIVGM